MYILGYICGIVGHRIKIVVLTAAQKTVLTGVLFVLSIMIGCLNPEASIWSNSYGKNYLIFILGSIVGFYGLDLYADSLL